MLFLRLQQVNDSESLLEKEKNIYIFHVSVITKQNQILLQPSTFVNPAYKNTGLQQQQQQFRQQQPQPRVAAAGSVSNANGIVQQPRASAGTTGLMINLTP